MAGPNDEIATNRYGFHTPYVKTSAFTKPGITPVFVHDKMLAPVGSLIEKIEQTVRVPAIVNPAITGTKLEAINILKECVSLISNVINDVDANPHLSNP